MFHYQSRIFCVVLCFFVSIKILIAQEYTASYTTDPVNKNSKMALTVSNDSIQEYRSLAIKFANKFQPKEATDYIVKYINATSDMSFLNDHIFKSIENSGDYQNLKEKYALKVDFLGLFYLGTGLLGIFAFIFLNFKKSPDKTSSFIISLFVLLHAVSLLHVAIYAMRIQYYLPHTLFVSKTFPLLYGPLLYLYCKRKINKLKLRDTLHILPSLILLVYIYSYYLMSRLEKFNIAFNQDNTLLPGTYIIIAVKILSLALYTYLLVSIYNKNQLRITNKRNPSWLYNIIVIHIVYMAAFIIYAAGLVMFIKSPLLYYLQSIIMVFVMFFVAYIAHVQSKKDRGKIKLIDSVNLLKYKKSGLTPSYSKELTDKLLKLLNEDKIFKENNLNLDMLSEKLKTTRHNTSQIINQHFKMSFSELINKYRILEAVDILKNNGINDLKIVQIAYDVGFNNKASFYKAFKKHLSQTPSQYIESLFMLN